MDDRTSNCAIGSGTAASQVGGDTVGAGSWVVLGAEQGFDAAQGSKEFIRCRATDVTDNRQLDAHATAWAEYTSGAQWSGTTYLGKLTATGDTGVQFRCGQDDNTGESAYSDSGSYALLRE